MLAELVLDLHDEDVADRNRLRRTRPPFRCQREGGELIEGAHIEIMSTFEADELLTRIKFKMVAMW